jgi:type VI secretion system protein ImpL
MIQAAQRKRIQSQYFELRWTQGDLSVPVQLRILSSPATAAAPAATPSATAAGGRPEPLPAKVVGLDAAMKLAQEALP